MPSHLYDTPCAFSSPVTRAAVQSHRAWPDSRCFLWLADQPDGLSKSVPKGIVPITPATVISVVQDDGKQDIIVDGNAFEVRTGDIIRAARF